MPTLEQKARTMLKNIKKAEDDLVRTEKESNWTSDSKLRRIKPHDRAAYVANLKKKVAALNAEYRELELNSRTHGGTRRRRRGTRHTRSTRALTARRR